MSLTYHQDLPDFIFHRPKAGEPSPPDNKWSGIKPPPAIGEEVVITFHDLGHGTVIGYFIDHSWLGVNVRLHSPPRWYVEQNKHDGRAWERGAHCFGIDLKGWQ